MAEPRRLSLRETKEELEAQGLNNTPTRPPHVIGFYSRKYYDTCLLLSRPIRDRNAKTTKDCKCLFSTPRAVGCNRYLFEGRLYTWTLNYQLYGTRLRYFIGFFPVWSQVSKEPVKKIEAPKFARSDEANDVIDTTIDDEDLEEEVEEAKEENGWQ